ncbi:MAG TPA: hypothetical protein VGO93_03865 [Candidatus Xenobia bacterium]
MHRLLFLVFLLLALPAHAWMPYTHVYLAEEALREAHDHGSVTIWQVDPVQGRRLHPIGTFKVDPELVSAIEAHRGEYHAGLMGPDAFPDIPTGEYAIHPDNEVAGHAGPIADEWLEELWRRSRGPIGTRGAEKAFVLGFLQHAAGDMMAHDFINYITGGEYTFAHHNALKHVTIESYVAQVTPPIDDPHAWDLSVDSISAFLVDTLVHTPLLSGDGGKLSILAWIQALRTAPFPPPDDIQAHVEQGLAKWPGISAQMAQATMFNPSRKPDWAAADTAVHNYLDVLNTMITEDEMVSIYEKIRTWIPATAKDDLMWFRNLRKMKAGIAMAIMQHIEEKEPNLKGLSAALNDGENVFDSIVAQKEPNYTDHPVSLDDFRHNYLRMEPFQKTWDYHRFRPAYNTFVICQVSLLPPSELRRLASTLRQMTGRGPYTGDLPPNVCLGYIRSMNGSHQWRPGTVHQPSILFDDQSFRLIFMNSLPEEAGR